MDTSDKGDITGMDVVGSKLVVHYSAGESHAYDIVSLAFTWRRTSNDRFYERYGFDWPDILPSGVAIDNAGKFPLDDD